MMQVIQYIVSFRALCVPFFIYYYTYLQLRLNLAFSVVIIKKNYLLGVWLNLFKNISFLLLNFPILTLIKSGPDRFSIFFFTDTIKVYILIDRYNLIGWSNCVKEIIDEKCIDKTFFSSILVIVFF